MGFGLLLANELADEALARAALWLEVALVRVRVGVTPWQR